MKFIKRFLRDEKGQALPLFALLVVVVFGFTALAFDVGNTVYSKSKLQLAADAAALAASLEIPPIPKDWNDDSEKNIMASTVKAKIIATGEEMAKKQGITPNGITVTPYIKDGKVKVELTKTVDHFFAKIINVNSTEIQAEAVAKRYAIWDGSVLPLVNMNADYWNTNTDTGMTFEIRNKSDDSTSDRDWIYIAKYLSEQDVSKIEDLRINPLNGLLVTKGGNEDYIGKYLEPLLKYPGPYFVYSISQEVLNGLGGESNSGVGVYDGSGNPQTRFLIKNNDKKYTPYENSDKISPYAKKVNGKYVPCEKGDTGAVEQIKILEIGTAVLSGSGANNTMTVTVTNVHPPDFTSDSISEIGQTKSRLIE